MNFKAMSVRIKQIYGLALTAILLPLYDPCLSQPGADLMKLFFANIESDMRIVISRLGHPNAQT